MSNDETALAVVDGIDRAIELAGDDLGKLQALEAMAEAVRRWSGNFDDRHAQRVAAVVAKWKIARHGGRVLIDMADRGERRRRAGNPRSSSAPELEELGLTKQRSARWQAVALMTETSYLQRRGWAAGEGSPEEDLAEDEVARASGSGDFEWFTPGEYIEAARRVMGGIDLDPASTPAANEVVGAAAYFTAKDDGLRQDWAGRVWMNPPYSAKLVAKFSKKLAEDYAAGSVTQACVLLNNTTETTWFQRLGRAGSALCLPGRRVRFWHPDKEDAESPKQGQAVLYLGPNSGAFCDEFKAFGLVAVMA